MEGSPGRRERNSQKRREHLLRIARRLFDAQGVEATSVRQIADEADVALRTVYNFFPTKVDMLAAALSAEMRAQLAASQPGHDTLPADPREGMLELVRTQLAALDASAPGEQRQVLARAILAGAASDAGRYVTEVDAHIQSAIRDLLAEYAKRGALPSGLDLDDATALIFHFLNGYYLVWLQNEGPFSAILPAVARHLDRILRS